MLDDAMGYLDHVLQNKQQRHGDQTGSPWNKTIFENGQGNDAYIYRIDWCTRPGFVAKLLT